MSETLATEVAEFGIKISLVEPNGFATEWSSGGPRTEPIEAYDSLKNTLKENRNPEMFGNPEATTSAILNLVDSSNPPLRLLLGKVAYPFVKKVYEERLASWEEWKEVSRNAHGY